MPKPRKKPLVKVVCKNCGRSYFIRQGRVGKSKFCSKSCSVSSQMRKQHAARKRKPSKPGMKVCLICDVEKQKTEFYKRPSNQDGLRSDCKTCCQRRNGAWLAKDGNRERKIQIDRRYYEETAEDQLRAAAERYAANKELFAERAKKWRENNLELAREISRRRRREKPELVRAARRQHYRENKGRYVAQARAREERIKRATPPWADMKAIERFYVEAERLTRETGTKHHVDHYYPLKGKTMCGLHVPANLRVVPALVNLRKGNSVPEECAESLCYA